MKIIHRGQNPAERLLRATCKTCGTVVEFTAGEAKKQYHPNHDPRDPRERPYYTYEVKCPICPTLISKVDFQ